MDSYAALLFVLSRKGSISKVFWNSATVPDDLETGKRPGKLLADTHRNTPNTTRISSVVSRLLLEPEGGGSHLTCCNDDHAINENDSCHCIKCSQSNHGSTLITPPTAMRFRSREEIICNDAEDSLFAVTSANDGRLTLASLLADDDHLMTRYAASFFKKHIGDALNPLLGSVVSALETQVEADRKQRGKFLALEEKKLVQRRKKIQSLKPRRGGRCQRRRRRRASSAKSSRLTQLCQGASTEACSDAVKFCRR